MPIIPYKADVECIGKLLLRMAVQVDGLPKALHQSAGEVCGEDCDRAVANSCLGNLTGLAKAHLKEDVLSARPPSAFVAGTVDQGLDVKACPHVQGANTLGCIELVAGYGKEINAKGLYIEGNLPY